MEFKRRCLVARGHTMDGFSVLIYRLISHMSSLLVHVPFHNVSYFSHIHDQLYIRWQTGDSP